MMKSSSLQSDKAQMAAEHFMLQAQLVFIFIFTRSVYVEEAELVSIL